ncbi:RND transporter [Burkholderia lata]|uniref:efflux transporter outer membrane subunit n=1 Tax=Burkholderia lata (strain ATCC 17760 / DSM 23089 / LMG 22485 / NCIMB 9086 / R18194 / 383) TaxID=482957 RepID=UPI0014537E81|nr:efflux transporter outer membrane subunit [Burkholderia lata]VWC90752.1 RND transporter [Burkholderia lata]
MADRLLAVWLGSVALLAGCSLAPTYRAPAIPVPAAFRETGAWVDAAPADRLPRDGWWRVYGDATLDRLEPLVARANPDLAAAVARHDEAAALFDEAHAALLPTVGIDAETDRDRQSARRPLRGSGQPDTYESNTLEAGFGYDVDLWGKVRNAVAAGRDDAQAADDDLASVRLSLQAGVASTYFDLAGLDREADTLAQTIDTYRRAWQLTVSRHRGGLASGLDVSRAQTQLALAQARASDIAARRALDEHAIAALVGASASTFSLPLVAALPGVPSIPTGLASTLLERRPDVAAAERRVAAANARIGVARAAYFPDLSLGLDAGFQSDTFSPWLAAPNEIWSIGPRLAMTLFDGGRRAAGVRNARAQFNEQGARYRAVVLQAFREVEDDLAQLHRLGDESDQDDAALVAARHSLAFAMSRYRDGAVSYLDVVTAQTTELDTQIASLDVDARRLQASVGLVRALGGGWHDTRS